MCAGGDDHVTIAPTVLEVLAGLEERSRRERPELDALNAQGAGATRAAAPRLMLDVGPDVGRLLNLTARLLGARRILEIGGSTGYSTVWLAEAAAATGGLVTSVELDPEKSKEQRRHLEAAGLLDHVELLVGDAHELCADLEPGVDLVLIDHWKDVYVREFDLVWPKVRTGGVVVADNILQPEATIAQMQAYVAHVRAAQGALSYTIDVGDGVEMTLRTEAAGG
jgi:predicted O-methyltransferase YrrM